LIFSGLLPFYEMLRFLIFIAFFKDSVPPQSPDNFFLTQKKEAQIESPQRRTWPWPCKTDQKKERKIEIVLTEAICLSTVKSLILLLIINNSCRVL
jgi:hypothetical protein